MVNLESFKDFFSEHKLRQFVKNVKPRCAPGSDGNGPEHIKNMHVILKLLFICVNCLLYVFSMEYFLQLVLKVYLCPC